MSLATRISAKVVAAIGKVRRTATVTIETATGEYDPTAGTVGDFTETTATVTISPLFEHRRGLDDAGARTGAGRFVVAADGLTHVPKAGEKWTIDGESWTVLEVKRIAVQATTVAYSLTVERGAR